MFVPKMLLHVRLAQLRGTARTRHAQTLLQIAAQGSERGALAGAFLQLAQPFDRLRLAETADELLQKLLGQQTLGADAAQQRRQSADLGVQRQTAIEDEAA